MPLPVEAAYLAGFIDGEGSFGIYYMGDHHRDNRNGNRYYCARLRLSVTDKDVLDYLSSVWSGVVLKTSNHGFGCEPLYILQWQSQSSLLTLLPQIIPYLRIKRMQAELLLEWCKSRQTRETHKAGYTNIEIQLAQAISGINSNKGRRRQDRVPVTS